MAIQSMSTLRLATTVVLTFLSGCGETAPSHGEVGRPAPGYSAVSMAGDTVHIDRLKSEVVLLNVWATWCVPCRVEIPELQALHQEFRDRGLRVIGVSVDERGADAVVADFARHFGITYTILRDADERISSLFFTPGVPASFLIDRAGVVRWRHLGPFRATNTSFRTALDAAL
jgi:cytochrome c-type biogenesis protein